MLKYPCLVMDHDDTVVQSEATVNYPFFVYILDQFRPGTTITLEQYVDGCCNLGFARMCREWYGFTEQELVDEYLGWQEYIQTHIPAPFPGIGRLLRRQREAGGLICVVSHSWASYIRRDYRSWGAPEPELIYDWSLPACFRKPSPWPLWEISRILGVAPREMLMVDDLQPGRSMARSAGVDFAAAGWAEAVPDVRLDMQTGGGVYCESVSQLANLLFSGQ